MGEETEKPNKVGVVATVSKRPRHRKKLLYQALKKQMEFYFSDVNISKDRFMNDLLQKSPYVDLWVFLNFNKIKTMTTKVKDIANALQSSDFLKVTEDGKQVYRITPPQKKENSDECTIYVEQIPLDADHSWLTDIFQTYGPIDYVSIPKFKHSRKNKGFAFVEFKDAQCAKNALAAFSEIGGCLSNQMDPGNLCSIRTFEENENEINNKKIMESCTEAKGNMTNSTDQNNESAAAADTNNIDGVISGKQTKEEKNHKKRKHKSDDDDGNQTGGDDISHEEKTDALAVDEGAGSIANKQMKDEINRRKRKCSSDPGDDSGKKRVDEKSQGSTENESSVAEGNINQSGRLKRKRKSSESSKVANSGNEDNEVAEPAEEESSQVRNVDDCDANVSNTFESDSKEFAVPNNEEYDENVEENVEDDNDDRKKKNRRKRKKHRKNKTADNSFGLQILSKMEWKSLRNRYLNEQRRKMKELKQYIRHKRYNDTRPATHGNGCYNNRNTKGHNENTANYADQKSEKANTVDAGSGSDMKVQLSSRLTLTPGLIAKVTLPEPVLSKSSFKNEVKIFPEIKYVDVREGLNEVFLRFSSTAAAEQCVQSGHWANAEIIKDDEEKAYWDKIAHEREEKLSKGRSVKRGRDKLLKKAEDMHIKHIWFD